MNFAVVFLILFGLVVILIGAYAAKFGAKTSEDYFIGGRTIGTVATFFGLLATQMSAFIFMGMPAFGYISGIGAYSQLAIAVPQILLYWLFFRKMWEIGHKNRYITQADYLADRYQSPVFMRIVPTVLGMLTIVGGHFLVQFMATGFIFNVISQGKLPYWFGIVFAGVVVGLIVLMGGFRATAWTDIFFGVYMLAALVGIYLVFTNGIGQSLPQAMQNLSQKFPGMTTLPGQIKFWSPQMIFTWFVLMAFSFIMYPHVFMRAYAARDPKIFRTVGLYWTPAITIVCAVPILIGVLGHLVWATPKDIGAAPDTLVVQLVDKLSPYPWLVPVLLAGALAAILSTISGSVIALSAMFMHDIIKKSVKSNLGEGSIVVWSRVVVAVATLLAMWIALLKPAMIAQLFSAAVGVLGLYLIPVVGGVLWPRLNGPGAIAGWTVGELFFLWFTYGPKSMGAGYMNNPSWLGFGTVIWAIAIQIVVTLVVTYATAPPPPAVRSKFFQASA